MNKNRTLFTSESVTEGHPDKVCDHIADSVLDAALAADPMSRIACEVCCTTGLVLVMGEFTTESYIDIPKIVRETVKEIGYTDAGFGFDYKTCAVLTTIDEQSADIAMGVNKALEARGGETDDALSEGAGDQGMMFGYACRETDELMPLPIMLAHKLTKKLAELRKSSEIPYLRPDGKAQVTVAYDDGVPVAVDTVVVSTQHNPGVEHAALEKDIIEKLIRPVITDKWLTPDTKYYVNPTGNFVIGGPQGDSGLTGRKIIVDTYGGMCPHGGGSFSGKDPTKVDRSATYYARYVCKNIVAAGLADKCRLQVAYAIGKANPVSLNIETFGTGKYSDEQILAAVNAVFDFRPYSIIKQLDLRKPVYAATSNYGHFGNPAFAWEKTDRAEALKKAIK
ncbi:MAG TPA: methionine adenosyltransferase [Clostridiales bacterium]|nr:methionine adenosyltransferase [Clostridiales bacterium]